MYNYMLMCIYDYSTLNSNKCCRSNFLSSSQCVRAIRHWIETPTVNASRVSAGPRCPPTSLSSRSVQSASWYAFISVPFLTSNFHFDRNILGQSQVWGIISSAKFVCNRWRRRCLRCRAPTLLQTSRVCSTIISSASTTSWHPRLKTVRQPSLEDVWFKLWYLLWNLICRVGRRIQHRKGRETKLHTGS